MAAAFKISCLSMEMSGLLILSKKVLYSSKLSRLDIIQFNTKLFDLMNLRYTITSSLRIFSRNKLRTALTMTGVIIGVSSFITIVGIANSAQVIVKSKIYTFGTNAISVKSKKKLFTYQDLKKIKKAIHNVKYITPVQYHRHNSIKYKSNNIASRIFGVSNDFFKIKDWSFKSGRKFTDMEMRSYTNVVVIGNTLKETLFPQRNPIGNTIYVNNIPFRIIGVLEKMGVALSGRDFDNIAIVPYTTGGIKLFHRVNYDEMFISTSSPKVIDETINMIKMYFSNAHNVPIDKLTYLKIGSSKDKLEKADNVSNILKLLLANIALISLGVGGISIMNVMLATVTERMKEIGIRRAVGAKSIDIMRQFIVESSTLSIIGGMIGIVLGIIMYYVIVTILQWPFLLSISSIFLSFIFSACVGIFFGYYPALIASRKMPIEALNSV